jgi:hypothetical protein
MASRGKRKNGSKNAKRSISFSQKQLAKKFKHAKDFGVKGNFNPENIKKFKTAIEDHVFNAETMPIVGTYRGVDVTHYVHLKTGLNVIVDFSGQFQSGWKLSPAQLKHVLSTGKLVTLKLNLCKKSKDFIVVSGFAESPGFNPLDF